MQEKIKQNLNLTMYARKRADNGNMQFFLVGMIPAKVTWANGKEEDIELAEKIAVAPFSAAKALLGQKIAWKVFGDKLQVEILNELTAKFAAGIDKIVKDGKLGDKPFKLLTII